MRRLVANRSKSSIRWYSTSTSRLRPQLNEGVSTILNADIANGTPIESNIRDSIPNEENTYLENGQYFQDQRIPRDKHDLNAELPSHTIVRTPQGQGQIKKRRNSNSRCKIAGVYLHTIHKDMLTAEGERPKVEESQLETRHDDSTKQLVDAIRLQKKMLRSLDKTLRSSKAKSRRYPFEPGSQTNLSSTSKGEAKTEPVSQISHIPPALGNEAGPSGPTIRYHATRSLDEIKIKYYYPDSVPYYRRRTPTPENEALPIEMRVHYHASDSIRQRVRTVPSSGLETESARGNKHSTRTSSIPQTSRLSPALRVRMESKETVAHYSPIEPVAQRIHPVKHRSRYKKASEDFLPPQQDAIVGRPDGTASFHKFMKAMKLPSPLPGSSFTSTPHKATIRSMSTSSRPIGNINNSRPSISSSAEATTQAWESSSSEDTPHSSPPPYEDWDSLRLEGSKPDISFLSPRQRATFPLSPLMAPPITFWSTIREPKAPPSENLTPLQKRLHRNPFALALASPVRMCTVTRTWLPRSFLQSFELLPRPESNEQWYLPRDLALKVPHDELAAGETNKPTNKGRRSYLLANKELVKGLASKRSGVTDGWRRFVLPNAKVGAQLRWRSDMDEFACKLMRKGIENELVALIKAKKGLVVHASSWDDVVRKKQMGAVLWLGPYSKMEKEKPDWWVEKERDDAVKKENVPQDSSSVSPLTDESGPGPLATISNPPNWEKKLPLHNLVMLLGQEGVDSLRAQAPQTMRHELVAVKDKEGSIRLRRMLWKLQGFLAKQENQAED